MVTIDDVKAARERIAPYIHRTPLERNETLSREFGSDVYLKLELFQKTGSFKPRGAINQFLMADPSAKTKGIIGFSGGNFAQGMAYAGQVLNIPTTVLMPETTPRHYIEATRGYGTAVETAADIAAVLAEFEKRRAAGMIGVHPYDNPHQVAGNGTASLEIVEDVPNVTDVFFSIGGGGWIYGNTVALKSLIPNVRIWGVETEKANTMSEAFKAGKPVSIIPTSLTKTLGAPIVSADSFSALQQHAHRLMLVTDEEAIAAQRFLLEHAKVLAELAAACTLAAARKVANELGDGKRIVLALCGGNESMDSLAQYTTM
jgi:threonine dehydratase